MGHIKNRDCNSDTNVQETKLLYIDRYPSRKVFFFKIKKKISAVPKKIMLSKLSAL